MKNCLLTLLVSATVVLSTAGDAAAQTAPASGSDGGLKVSVYPVMVFVPLGIGIDVEIPPFEGGGGGEVVDTYFDGAFLGGFSLAGGAWRLDTHGLWAAVGGDRVETPILTVDVDAIYFYATGGRKIVKDLYLTGGVRRLALKYNVRLGDRPNFERKPGIWDPLVGVGWHSDANEKLEVHSSFDAGGFWDGSDLDLSGMFRVDWKPVRWFGLTGGYHFLYLEITDDVLSRAFTVKQTLHGPVMGVGFYF